MGRVCAGREPGKRCQPRQAPVRTALSKYFAGDESVTNEQMKELARAYSQALARTFGHKGKAQIGVDITFAAVTGPVGVGITATGFGASRAPPAQKLIARLGQTHPRKWIRELPADEAARMTPAFALSRALFKTCLRECHPSKS